jgi:hypothetical protein
MLRDLFDGVLGFLAVLVLGCLALCGGCAVDEAPTDGHVTWLYCERAFACGAEPELCFTGALAPDDPEACAAAITAATCAELEAPPC